MNPDDYLEICLKERFGGKNNDEINVIKENLIKYLKKRNIWLYLSLLKKKKIYYY